MIRQTMGLISQWDPEAGASIREEFARECRNIELIASENLVSEAVMLAMGTCLTNKYAEGYPGKRYYGGCYAVDVTEEIAQWLAMVARDFEGCRDQVRREVDDLCRAFPIYVSTAEKKACRSAPGQRAKRRALIGRAVSTLPVYPAPSFFFPGHTRLTPESSR